MIISHHTLFSEGLDVVAVATLICFYLLRGEQLSVSDFLFICVWKKVDERVKKNHTSITVVFLTLRLLFTLVFS